jgi:UDP-2,3-diacylglucosamine hydrolase
MLRCAAALVIAAYVHIRLIPRDFARLACGTFYEAVQNVSCFDFYEFIMKSIFLSDAHLKSRRDPCYRDLMGFLEGLRGAGVDHLFIAGDFFDFWFCKDHEIYPEFEEIIEKLVLLKATGIQITFCEGNHDFFLKGCFEKKLGMNIHEDWAVIDLDGRKTLLAHGDLVDRSNRKYMMLRKILRSRLFYEIQARTPSAVLWRLARLSSYTSRRLSLESEDRIVRRMLAFSMDKFREGFDTVILGHSHQPVLKEFLMDGRQKTFVTLGDWTRHKSYLQYEDGRYRLCYYQTPA